MVLGSRDPATALDERSRWSRGLTLEYPDSSPAVVVVAAFC